MAIKRCTWCNGTGKAYSRALNKYVTCDSCKGSGRLPTRPCRWCSGTGRAYSTVLRKYVVCDSCKGTGDA